MVILPPTLSLSKPLTPGPHIAWTDNSVTPHQEHKIACKDDESPPISQTVKLTPVVSSISVTCVSSTQCLKFRSLQLWLLAYSYHLSPITLFGACKLLAVYCMFPVTSTKICPSYIYLINILIEWEVFNPPTLIHKVNLPILSCCLFVLFLLLLLLVYAFTWVDVPVAELSCIFCPPLFLQSRYVAYYERLLTHMEGNLPPPVTLRIREISIYGLTSEWTRATSVNRST